MDSDRSKRTVFLNGFPSEDAFSEAELADYFGVLFGGHVTRAIAKISKFNSAFALVEFDDSKYADQVLHVRKHYIDGNRFAIAWPYRNSGQKTHKNGQEEQSKNSNQQIDFPHEIDMILHVNDLSNFHQSISIIEDERTRRENLRIDLQNRLLIDTKIWPENLKLVLYGSSVNGFGFKNCDLDLTLIEDENGKEKSTKNDGENGEKAGKEPSRLTWDEFQKMQPMVAIEVLACCVRLEKDRITDVLVVHGRRCPVVKFSYCSANGYVDAVEICLGNRAALENTIWLRSLNDKFTWLPILYALFRIWLARFDLASKSPMTFNGYTLALVTVAYCQSRNLLNKVENEDASKGWSVDSAFIRQLFIEMLLDLCEVRFKQTVFSPVTAETGNLASQKSITSLYYYLNSGPRYNSAFTFSCINVQDPFDLSHNTASNINESTLQRLQKTLNVFKAEKSTCSAAELFEMFWTRKLDSSYSEHLFNESNPVFYCEPSAENLLYLILSNNRMSNLQDQWCILGEKSILEILEKLLHFRTAVSCENEAKFHCLAWQQTWQYDKRKTVSQDLYKSLTGCGLGVLSRFELELRVTEKMIDEISEMKKSKKKKQKVEPAAEFLLTLKRQIEENVCSLEADVVCENKMVAYGLKKFLYFFLPTVFDDAFRRVFLEKE